MLRHVYELLHFNNETETMTRLGVFSTRDKAVAVYNKLPDSSPLLLQHDCDTVSFYMITELELDVMDGEHSTGAHR